MVQIFQKEGIFAGLPFFHFHSPIPALIRVAQNCCHRRK